MIPGIPDKIIHFVVLCLVIATVVTVLKKDEAGDVGKSILQNFAMLAMLILFFCVVLQFIGALV